jgi:hypothetical protein
MLIFILLDSLSNLFSIAPSSVEASLNASSAISGDIKINRDGTCQFSAATNTYVCTLEAPKAKPASPPAQSAKLTSSSPAKTPSKPKKSPVPGDRCAFQRKCIRRLWFHRSSRFLTFSRTPMHSCPLSPYLLGRPWHHLGERRMRCC